MEKGIESLDFETIDQMVQIHDYLGVSLSSRDANSKKAANEATAIFTEYYPEFLVCHWLSDLGGSKSFNSDLTV